MEDGRPASSTRRRPADVFLPRWRQGSSAALEFAVTSGMRTSELLGSSQNAQATTTQYEDYKANFQGTKAQCQAQGIQFIPMIMEAHGGGVGHPRRRRCGANLPKLRLMPPASLLALRRSTSFKGSRSSSIKKMRGPSSVARASLLRVRLPSPIDRSPPALSPSPLPRPFPSRPPQ